jgi:hypothetical protein
MATLPEERVRMRKGYAFFKRVFQRLEELGLKPETSLQVLGLFHEVIDGLKGYRYAWRAMKNKETLEQFTRDINDGQLLPAAHIPALFMCSGRCNNNVCEHRQPHREKDACRTDRCDWASWASGEEVTVRCEPDTTMRADFKHDRHGRITQMPLGTLVPLQKVT